ncbi:PIGR protein, partial [Eudromia elegans]|nr:PIGR protein [Eudromia elegans]
MTVLAFLAAALLLSLLPAEAARSKYPPKSAILNPIFGPREVNGLLDGSVTVKCFYPRTTVNKHDRKYWCREGTRSCQTIVSSNGYVAPGYQGRASITDFPEQGVFLVNVSGLALADRGSYRCGLGLNNKALSFQVKLDVSEGPNVPEEAELFYVELHGSVTITCSFGPEYASTRKYLCKMERSGCRNIIDTYGKVDDDYAGRILLSNENTAGSYSIMMTQLDWGDAGLYLCGAGVYGESGETKEVDLHVYQGTDVPQGKHTVLGVKGGSVTIECHYNSKERSSLKYWCKWRKNGCSRIIDSNGFVSDLYEGRVAMHDDPENSTVTIILNRLADSDNGYYWCMTDEKREKKTSKELKVVDGEPSLRGDKEVEAGVGTQVQLACSYPCKYYSYEKYWCKWTREGCTPVEASDQSHPELKVDCDKDNKTVLLHLDDVALTDQGWYWCGVKHKGIYGETMATFLRVFGGELHSKSGQGLPRCPLPRRKRFPYPLGCSTSRQQRSHLAAKIPWICAGPSSLVVALVSVGGVFLVLATVFAVYKYRQIKRSDLVSVGSYRTNISMSDFESAKEYGANDNACMKGTRETQIGGDELVSTGAEPESTTEAKKAKRSSKEEADVAYSAFLLQASAVAQGHGAEGGGDAAAPPEPWDGHM